MTSETWPPPPSPSDRWVVRPLIEGTSWRARPVRLREVVGPWGRLVDAAEDGRIYCSACSRLIGLDELGDADNNVHAPGVPMRSGRLRLIDDDDVDHRRADDLAMKGF